MFALRSKQIYEIYLFGNRDLSNSAILHYTFSKYRPDYRIVRKFERPESTDNKA